jgi:hypothetical protein
MGCTTIFTLDDHKVAMKSLGLNHLIGVMAKENRMAEPLTAKRRADIRAELHKSTASGILQMILKNPDHPAFQSVTKFLVKSLPSKMTEVEKQHLPNAYRVVLERQPTAMGVFMAATKERAPGQSAVQHHYEISSTAALIESKFQTNSGKTLSIDPVDRVDFGIKMATGYAQTKKGGTIEADVLVHKGNKTMGIDAKYSSKGVYDSKGGLERQLRGIRRGFRDGKIDEFVFVTNGKFSEPIKEMVKQFNAKITRDVIKEMNFRVARIPREYLTNEEKLNTPSGPIPKSFLNDQEKLEKFASETGIPQIDVCENVTFKK